MSNIPIDRVCIPRSNAVELEERKININVFLFTRATYRM